MNKHPFGMIMIRVFKMLNVLSIDMPEGLGDKIDKLL